MGIKNPNGQKSSKKNSFLLLDIAEKKKNVVFSVLHNLWAKI